MSNSSIRETAASADLPDVAAVPVTLGGTVDGPERRRYAEPAPDARDADLGETKDVADERPDVVARLAAVAEAARDDIGDYNRVGKGAQRFFDSGPRRPDAAMWSTADTK